MARSIVSQGLYLQREVTPGTPLTNAMRRYQGIKGRIGWDVEKEYFRAAGSKAVTGENTLTEIGTADLEVIQDYNAMLPLLAGVFGPPVTTPLAIGPPAAYEHVFEIDPYAAEVLAAFTAMWGDPVRALRATYMVFHGLTFGVQRNELSLSANAILRAPETGIALPSSGVTTIPMQSVRASKYNVFVDTTWAGLGTTKLRLYATEIQFGDRLGPDWVIDSELASFSELLENDDIDYTQSLVVGFDAAAESLIDEALDGELKFVRTAATGADINGTDAYALEFDTAVRLVPGMVNKSPVSNATVVEFDGTLQVDPLSGKFARVRLVNTLASL
jgi:hypothetical protein